MPIGEGFGFVFGKIEIVEDFKTISEITTKLISKVLLNYVEPTMMVSFLFLTAIIGPPISFLALL